MKLSIKHIIENGKLKLLNTKLTKAHLNELADYIVQKQIVSLEAWDCHFPQGHEFKQMINKLFNCQSFQELKITRPKFNDNQLAVIAETLSNPGTTLKRLHLENSSCRDKEAQLFADMLKQNNSLEHLGLPLPNFDTEGGEIITAALKDNHTLKSLDLNFVESNEICCENVYQAAQVNPKLTSVLFKGVHLGNFVYDPQSSLLEVRVRIYGEQIIKADNALKTNNSQPQLQNQPELQVQQQQAQPQPQSQNQPEPQAQPNNNAAINQQTGKKNPKKRSLQSTFFASDPHNKEDNNDDDMSKKSKTTDYQFQHQPK